MDNALIATLLLLVLVLGLLVLRRDRTITTLQEMLEASKRDRPNGSGRVGLRDLVREPLPERPYREPVEAYCERVKAIFARKRFTLSENRKWREVLRLVKAGIPRDEIKWQASMTAAIERVIGERRHADLPEHEFWLLVAEDGLMAARAAWISTDMHGFAKAIGTSPATIENAVREVFGMTPTA